MRPSRSLGCLAVLALSGCSWLGMTRPPSPPIDPSPPPTCTTSRTLPALDTTAAVLVGIPAVVFTGWAIATPVDPPNCSLLSSSSQPPCSLFAPQTGGAKAGMIVGGLAFVGFAVAEAVSAANGFGWAARCEEIQEAQLACVSGVEASCAALRRAPREEGKSPGSVCSGTEECREGDVCYLGHCQVGPR
jgi:hypothetical protein